ncbi:hypothetical protein C8R46DRAFT_1365594 [Mycena filopes]|nr:hypothetical protein C8R46DRAFT_1365594 [Mycena filopes]
MLEFTGQQARPYYFTRIPHEILLMIFRKSLPPPWLLHGTTQNVFTPQSFYSTDLTAKLSILAVCKDWHQVATEILYEIVHPRRIGQLPAFVRALEEHAGLGNLVKRLDLSCMVPRGYSTRFQNGIQALFQFCPRLSHFSFVPVYLVPAVAYSLPVPTALSITTLELSSVVQVGIISPLLRELCRSLRSLTLPHPTNPEIEEADYEEWDIVADLTFPQLQDLHLSHLRAEYAMLTWQAPSLRRLWLSCDSISGVDISALIGTFGRNLTFLSLYRYPTSGIQDIVSECPLLEHLVAPLIALVSHRNIKYLDCWYWWHYNPPSTKAAFDRLKTRLPALRRFRYLNVTYSDLRDLLGLSLEEESEIKPPWSEAVLEFTEPHSMKGVVSDDETGTTRRELFSLLSAKSPSPGRRMIQTLIRGRASRSARRAI